MAELPSLKDLVKDNEVNFVRFHDNQLWYEIRYNYVEAQDAPVSVYNKFEFPVPIEDVGNATMLANDKALLFMRYVRKHIKTLEEGNGLTGNEGRN